MRQYQGYTPIIQYEEKTNTPIMKPQLNSKTGKIQMYNNGFLSCQKGTSNEMKILLDSLLHTETEYTVEHKVSEGDWNEKTLGKIGIQGKMVLIGHRPHKTLFLLNKNIDLQGSIITNLITKIIETETGKVIYKK